MPKLYTGPVVSQHWKVMMDTVSALPQNRSEKQHSTTKPKWLGIGQERQDSMVSVETQISAKQGHKHG
jgi:hypothetical protein